MTNLDKDDNLTESATVEQKRRQLKLLPKPLLRLVLLLAGMTFLPGAGSGQE